MRVTLKSSSPEQTSDIARQIGATLCAGDTLLMRGPVGAGKTHFARHLIWSVLKTAEDVPSPTFTLVQSYQTEHCELWHADLYRLSSLDEVEELGLSEAFETAICLIEWPELLGVLTPAEAIDIEISPDQINETSRQITLSATAEKWSTLIKNLQHET